MIQQICREGYPGKRYYEVVVEMLDVIETLAIERAKRLSGAEHANVYNLTLVPQANLCMYFALLTNPSDTIVGYELCPKENHFDSWFSS